MLLAVCGGGAFTACVAPFPQAFLTSHGLRLIIRSHEGPDARDKRSDLPQVLQGYSVDHTTPGVRAVRRGTSGKRADAGEARDNEGAPD